MKKNQKGGYAEAVAELQKILDELESDDVDVDALTQKVQRAGELIAFCQERLKAAEVEVKKVISAFAKTEDE